MIQLDVSNIIKLPKNIFDDKSNIKCENTSEYILGFKIRNIDTEYNDLIIIDEKSDYQGQIWTEK